jgi:predicted nuclease of predicted toxin-antitoxin system
MAKFLADESVDFRMVTHLREKGFEVQAILENHPGVSDDEVLQIAHESDAILITEDKDFGDLTYRLNKPNQGIILIRMSGVSIEEKVSNILQVLEAYLEELANSFTVLTRDKVRIRKKD